MAAENSENTREDQIRSLAEEWVIDYLSQDPEFLDIDEYAVDNGTELSDKEVSEAMGYIVDRLREIVEAASDGRI